MTIRQIACILKLGFLLKYFDKKQIGDWASKKIMENCTDINIIELAFIESKSNSSALTLLHPLTGEMTLHDFEFTNKYFLGLFRKKLMTEKTAARWIAIENEILEYFSIDDDLATDNDTSWLVSVVSNDYSLRTAGLNGVMKLPGDLIFLLEKFDHFDAMQEQLDREDIPGPQLKLKK